LTRPRPLAAPLLEGEKEDATPQRRHAFTSLDASPFLADSSSMSLFNTSGNNASVDSQVGTDLTTKCLKVYLVERRIVPIKAHISDNHNRMSKRRAWAGVYFQRGIDTLTMYVLG
jgi:hypothetical protein